MRVFFFFTNNLQSQGAYYDLCIFKQTQASSYSLDYSTVNHSVFKSLGNMMND